MMVEFLGVAIAGTVAAPLANLLLDLVAALAALELSVKSMFVMFSALVAESGPCLAEPAPAMRGWPRPRTSRRP